MPDPRPPARSERPPRLLFALLIAVLATLAYLPSLPGEFIWDDDDHVTHNDELRELAGLGRIWIPELEPEYKPHTPQYYPLTFSALWVQYQLFGLEAGGYHAVNLVLHILNSLLVWAVFARLRMPWAWLVGALFAVHPMHVETVAWAMEQKNLFSALFYLLAALAYLRFDEEWSAEERPEGRRSPWGWYALALGLFVLGLFSKSIIATLPAALILALLYLRARIDLRRLAPLVPFFVVGIGLALNTAHLEHQHVGAQGVEFDFTLADKLLISSRVLLFYPFKVLFPWPLLFVYPRWEIDPSAPLAWWPVVAVVAIAAVAFVAYRRGRRGAPLALAYFAGSAFPALGLITFYPMLFSFVADHFNYLPSLGILALVAGAVGTWIHDVRARWATSLALLLGLTALTGLQSAHFRSAETLYRHTLAHNPDAWLARAQLAQLLIHRGRPGVGEGDAQERRAALEEARDQLREAIALYDEHYMMYANLATVLYLLGDVPGALPHALRAIELRPDYVEALSNAGVLLYEVGRKDEAAEHARRALEADPENYKALSILGNCRADSGDGAGAVEFLRRAYLAAPNSASREQAGAQLAVALSKTSAAECLRTVEELNRATGLPQFHLESVRSLALAGLGRFPEAIAINEALLQHAQGAGDESLVRTLQERLGALRQAAGRAQ